MIGISARVSQSARWHHVVMLCRILIAFSPVVIFPILFLHSVLLNGDDGVIAVLALIAYYAALSTLYVVVSPWPYVGMRVRAAFVGVVVLEAVLGTSVAFVHRRVAAGSSSATQTAVYLTIALMCGIAAAYILLVRGRPREHESSLAFPLPSGSYCCVQGGGTIALNHHMRSRAQRFACDLVQLNDCGARASGPFPAHLEQYRIFGTPVLSPCDGIVARAIGDVPDALPGQRNLSRGVAGNVVVISAGDVDIVLAHLQCGSVRVHAGERVRCGVRIGSVGNSGNSSEPHLHVHAERNGVGVPLLLKNIRFYRNRSVCVGEESDDD